MEIEMDALVERLDNKLREWQIDKANMVRQQVNEIIDLVDLDILDISRSRSIEQEVLDLLDESETR